MLEKGSDKVHLLFLHGNELMLLLLLFLVAPLMLVVAHLIIHGLHEVVHADALLYSLCRWFWGWDGKMQCRRRSLW